MSEDAAFRRARAAKIARQFPILFEQIAAGEIHLTGLLMLGPHLTEENHREVLARAKHRSKREIARLVRMLDPLPDVPAVVEPLGPTPAGAAPRNPSWSEFVTSMSTVRELSPGNRPKDWTDLAAGATLGEPAPVESPVAELSSDPASTECSGAELAAQRYKVQFTATQEYVDLLEEARELLAHAVPSRSLEEVHLRAMRMLVTGLKKRKYAAADTPPSKAASDSRIDAASDSRIDADQGRAADEMQEPATTSTGHGGADIEGPASSQMRSQARRSSARDVAGAAPRRRGRYIRAAVRRAVWERDGGRCTYVEATGQRCRECGALEFDHVDPYARGGPSTVQNLRLRCAVHNALTAEQEFGREFMARYNNTTLRDVAPRPT
jgi:5-methylcytosine-specific restriction endonuclease McrA